MTQLDIYATGSPFDALKQSSATGAEWWSARDLMGPLGYERWERFADAIERAEAACNNSGTAARDHFRATEKVIEGGRWGQQKVADYALTRYGAYLVAMNGDPRKPEIAAAQTYFAARTREAEVRSDLDEIEVARRYLAALEDRKALAARVTELEPKAEAWEVLASAEGDFSVADAAKILSRDPNITIGQQRLFSVLCKAGWIFRQTADNRWRVYQAAVEAGRLSEIPASHYHPRTGELVLDSPQVRVTAKGLEELRRRLAARKDPSAGD